MRSLFFVMLLILPSAAFAQSRVVGDTFREGRESHLQSSQDMQQKFQDDGAVMMKERAANAEEVDADRAANRETTDEYQKQWVEDWNKDSDKRAANSAEVEQAREDRRTASMAAPEEWWRDDESADNVYNDFDDLNQ